MSSNPVVLTALGTITAAYVFLCALLRLTQDSREPPEVLKSIPFLLPILGMMAWSMDFYPRMRERHQALPMYTLRIPGARIYVVNSLDLIPAVQRQWRTLLFPPIHVKAAKAAMGASKDAVAVLEHDMITENGFINGMIKVTHPTVSTGPSLDDLTAKVFQVFDEALNRLSTPTTVKMFQWVEEHVMHASTDAVYGPLNPMRDAQNLKAWHMYHSALMFMMIAILPQNVFFRAAVQAREKLVKSFAKYYRNGGYEQGSAYVKQFVSHCIKQQIPRDDLPRFLVGTVFNNVANTIPSAFWVVYRIFSDPAVLEDCRNEVSQAVQDQDGVSTIDLTFILNSCPILLSIYQEVFRYHGMANSVRVVSEDQMLDSKYLLKKGGLVMISARAQHSNAAVWGDDADKFYHKRFVRQNNGGKRPNPAAFRGFGGGATLCPGRHFATSEILMLATLLPLRFEVRPKALPWVKPSTRNSSQAEAMEQPDQDVEIVIVPRPEASNKTWRLACLGRRDAVLLESN